MAMSHYGSFAGGFINAYLQARKLRMQQAYYEARIADMEAARKGNTGNDSSFEWGRTHPQGLGGPGGSTKDWSKTAAMAEGTNKEVYDYIVQKANALHIDPNVALSVANSEGLKGFDPKNPDKGGDGGSSFGPFQFHYAGINKDMPNAGLGDEFTKATGKDARDPSTWRDQIDFALDHASKNGWGSWNGAKAIGVAENEGLNYGGGGGGSTPALVDARDKINASGGADASQLHPAFATRAAQLADEAYKATGVKLSFNELHRTYEQQAEIRAKHEAMQGGVALHPAAQAGHSNHETGTAGDMDDNAASRWAKTPGPDGVRPIDRVGLETLPGETGKNDPNHIQLPRADYGKTAQADTNQGYQVAGLNDVALSPEAAARSRAELERHRATPDAAIPPDPRATALQGAATDAAARRREIGNTQLAPPGPDQRGQYGVDAVSGFAHLPTAPRPPAPRQDAITPQDTSRQSDPRAVPQDDSRSISPRLQAPYNPDARSIESQPTFPPVQGREVGPENVGKTTGRDWRETDQPSLPPVQGREVGPENAGQRAWTPDSQPPFPPVQGREVGPENAGQRAWTPDSQPPFPPVPGIPPRGMPARPISTGRMPVDNSPAARNMPFVGEGARTGQYDARGVYAPKPPVRTPASNVPAKNAQPAVMLRPAPRAIPAPTDNGRFVMVDRPNADPTQRGRQGAPQMSALNLSGLFGGRQPAPTPAPAPAPAFVPPPAPPPRPQPPVYRQPSIRMQPSRLPDNSVTVGAPNPPSVPDTPTTPPAAQEMTAMNYPPQQAIPPGPGRDTSFDDSDERMLNQDDDQGAMAARRGGAVRYYTRGGAVRKY